MMSMHRLSAGAGYRYLLKHTASGDTDLPAKAELTAYYAASGNLPGRWFGPGLAGLPGGALAPGTPVSEDAMASLFGHGADPTTAAPLGARYPTYPTPTERINKAVAALPASMPDAERSTAIDTITHIELAKTTRQAIAGFDLTFTVPKSASLLWGLGDPALQSQVVAAHRAAVDQSLDLLGRTALFTRVGAQGCAQVPTRGMIAAAFDHPDTRTGDPNLHTHVVVANKVQGIDGKWRSVDSRALHHAVVSISEVYDNLFADELVRRLPVTWQWRERGPRRSPAYELTGLPDALLTTFSTRSTAIDEAMTERITSFISARGRHPNRVEFLRLRQQVTRATRPNKQVHPIAELMDSWRTRAADSTGIEAQNLISGALRRSAVTYSNSQIPPDTVASLASDVLSGVMERRATWTTSNLLAETARATRDMRMSTPADRHALHERVVSAARDQCVSLDAPDLLNLSATYRRKDGTSVFTRVGETRYSHEQILAAEQRLLDATAQPDAIDSPVGNRAAEPIEQLLASPLYRHGRPLELADDQRQAVRQIVGSAARLDVLVGPAGSGKTTTMLALAHVWQTTHGPRTVRGLAPSATAATELSNALDIPCENTAKWLYESSGRGFQRRNEQISNLEGRIEAWSRRNPPQAEGARTQLAALRAEQAAWTIHADELIIVDEASLAGTRALDNLVTQAGTAGAKVVLVGDHAQLSAADAGGAFALLATRTNPAMLTSLWRFTEPWEAAATLALRVGDRKVIDTYRSQGRIASGPSEAMLEDAYTAWQTSETAGRSSVLLAASQAHVDALNVRAHNDRVNEGRADPNGVVTRAGVVITRGDRVVTRRNDRRLLLPEGGYVRNGALWDVVQTFSNGDLSVRRSGAPELSGDVVVLPQEYVYDDVALGYATTTHRAQGITVTEAHVLTTAPMSREHLYVAMTRGREVNKIYLATDDIDPLCDDLSDPHQVRTVDEDLERILATTNMNEAASTILARNFTEATSRSRLEPIALTIESHLRTGLEDDQPTPLDLDLRKVRRLLDEGVATAPETASMAGLRR